MSFLQNVNFSWFKIKFHDFFLTLTYFSLTISWLATALWIVDSPFCRKSSSRLKPANWGSKVIKLLTFFEEFWHSSTVPSKGIYNHRSHDGLLAIRGPDHTVFLKVSAFVSMKTKQNIFAHTGVSVWKRTKTVRRCIRVREPSDFSRRWPYCPKNLRHSESEWFAGSVFSRFSVDHSVWPNVWVSKNISVVSEYTTENSAKDLKNPGSPNSCL